MTRISQNTRIDAEPTPVRTAARDAVASTARPSAVVAGAVALLLAAAAAGRAEERKLDLGLYSQRYVMLLGTNEDWLVHPTGSYVDASDKKRLKQTWYEPEYRETDDMDGEIQEMIERGYVMIGYAAFNTAEAAPRLEDDPTYASMTPEEQGAYRLGLKLRGNLRSALNPVGDPRDAARWANASAVVLQRGFAFSRGKTTAHRVVANDVDDRTDSGSTSYTEQRGRSFQEVGNTKGDSQWQADSQDGSVYQEQGGSVRHQSRQHSTILLDQTVDHYDYFATFWKKADPRRVVFGGMTAPVPADLRREIGTRHGRMVSAVIGGTPAYDADIWEGDVLLEVQGERIVGEEGWNALLGRYQGQEVTVTLWREGETFAYPVRLNAGAASSSVR